MRCTAVVLCLLLSSALVGCKKRSSSSPPPPPPPQATSVTITAPATGATLRMNRGVTVTATEGGGATQLELFVDGVSQGVDTTSPFSFSFAWTAFSAPLVGSHTLQVVGTWPDSSTASASVNVTVANGPFSANTADHIVYGGDDLDAMGFPRGAGIGDVTGDGVADLVLGVPFGDGPTNGRGNCGEVVILSGATLGASTDLNNTSVTPTAIIYGGTSNDWFGYQVAVGDVNGDGTADVIVGAPQQDGPLGSRTDCGAVYVFFGGTGLTGTIDLGGGGMAGTTVYGATNTEYLGWTVAVGDVNGGGPDLVMGAPRLDAPGPPGRTDTGGAYVLYGGTGIPASLDLQSAAASVVIYGEDAGDEFGDGLTVGEITGDTYDDVILGSRRADGASDTGNDEGEVAVVAGGASLPASIDTATATPASIIYGADAQDELGTHIAVGDVDGVAGNELIVAAFLADGPANGRTDAGEVVIIPGGTNLPTSLDLFTTAPTTIIYGERTNDFLGYGLEAGDVDGDGDADLWIGQNGSDGPSGTLTDAGEAVWWSSPGATLPATFDLNGTAPALTLVGTDSMDRAGRAIGLGDLDGDGQPDLVAAADTADGPANVGTDRGEVVVLVR